MSSPKGKELKQTDFVLQRTMKPDVLEICKVKRNKYQDKRQRHLSKKHSQFMSAQTKFLLGGNIHDPLNLQSLQDDKINKELNAYSPIPSSIPGTDQKENYVPTAKESLDAQKPEFDIILCLKVTKWIHLNFGDDGLKLAFKRMYAQLRYGGVLILEPQPWASYSKSKRINPTMSEMYGGIRLKPEAFRKFLLSEVGFSSSHQLGSIFHPTKGYRSEIYLLTKDYLQGQSAKCPHPMQYDMLAYEHSSEDLLHLESENIVSDDDV